MKVKYDPKVDVLRILFSGASIEESDEVNPQMILDYDKEGNIVGMEILDASKRIENPRAVEYVMTGKATQNKILQHHVVYADLLGFKDMTDTPHSFNAQKLWMWDVVPILQNIGTPSLLDTWQYRYSLSDSIFLVTDNPNDAYPDLAVFFKTLFHNRIETFLDNEEREKQIDRLKKAGGNNQELVFDDELVLFNGGGTYDEVVFVPSLFPTPQTTLKPLGSDGNILGKGVTNAVRIGENYKGIGVMIDEKTWLSLGSARDYFCKIDDAEIEGIYYELLWLIDKNQWDTTLGNLDFAIKAAEGFWKNPKLRIRYKSLLRIALISVIRSYVISDSFSKFDSNKRSSHNQSDNNRFNKTMLDGLKKIKQLSENAYQNLKNIVNSELEDNNLSPLSDNSINT